MNVSTESSDRLRLSLHIPNETPNGRLRRASSTQSRPPSQHLPSFSLIGALEFRSVVTALRRESNASALEAFQQNPLAAGYYPRRSATPGTHHDAYSRDGSLELPHVHDPREYSSERNPWESTLEQSSPSPHDTRSSRRPSVLPPARKSPVPSILIDEEDVQSPGTDVSHVAIVENTRPHLSKRERLWSAFTRTMGVLFPTLVYFTDKSFTGMVAALFAAPAVLALTLTLPVVFTPHGDLKMPGKGTEDPGRPQDGGTAEGQLIDSEDANEDEGVEWTLEAEDIVGEEMHELKFNKWLMATQCILGPLFCAAVLLSEMKQFPLYATVIGISGTIAAVLVLIFADDGNDPAARVGRCSMGFFVAIVWIMAIADEVVQVLQVRNTLRLFRNTRYLLAFVDFRPNIWHFGCDHWSHHFRDRKLSSRLRSKHHCGSICTYHGLLCMLWWADAEYAAGSGLVWHLCNPPNRCRLSFVVQQDTHSHRRLLTFASHRHDNPRPTQWIYAHSQVGSVPHHLLFDRHDCYRGCGVERAK